MQENYSSLSAALQLEWSWGLLTSNSAQLRCSHNSSKSLALSCMSFMSLDQKSEKGFGFGLRLHGRDEQHIIDHTLVNHTFIHCDVSPPITVSTEPTISTGTHPSASPTGSTTDAPTATDETVPPDSCSTCDAMNEVADQLNHYLPHDCSRSENCSGVMCESHVADLNLYLGCSPVGMTLETIVHTDGLNTYNKALFTKPGTFDSMLFDSDFNVTVHNYNDEVLARTLEQRSITFIL